LVQPLAKNGRLNGRIRLALEQVGALGRRAMSSIRTRSATACLIALTLSGGDLAKAATKRVTAAIRPVQQRTLAPDFELKAADGKAVRLSGYRGRVVLLDFWATKCGGCVEEIPWFIEIADIFATKGLSTVGVSEDIAYENLKGADEAWTLVKPFVRDHKVSYPVLMGDRKVTTNYDIKALPLTYLIDRRGRVAAEYVGLVDRADLERNIRTLLSERSR
jgi:peroxiredoxin